MEVGNIMSKEYKFINTVGFCLTNFIKKYNFIYSRNRTEIYLKRLKKKGWFKNQLETILKCDVKLKEVFLFSNSEEDITIAKELADIIGTDEIRFHSEMLLEN